MFFDLHVGHGLLYVTWIDGVYSRTNTKFQRHHVYFNIWVHSLKFHLLYDLQIFWALYVLGECVAHWASFIFSWDILVWSYIYRYVYKRTIKGPYFPISYTTKDSNMSIIMLVCSWNSNLGYYLICFVVWIFLKVGTWHASWLDLVLPSMT